MDIKYKGKQYNISFKKRIIPCSIRTQVPNFTNTTNIAYLEGSKFLNKVVLVTGAYRGIGYSIATALYREGAKVIITGRNENKLKEVCDSYNKDRFQYIVWDVAETNRVGEMYDKAISIFGKIDYLVNNAGVTTDRKVRVDFESMSYDHVHYVHDINVLGTRTMCMGFIQRNTDGGILNIISNTGLRSAKDAYFTSKWAVYSLTKALGDYCKKQGKTISVNGICPGPIWTDMTPVKVVDRPECKNRRIGLPEDIGNLSIMMLHAGRHGISGKIVTCDGGELLY